MIKNERVMKVKVNTKKFVQFFFCYFWTVVNPKKTKKRKLEDYEPRLIKKKKKLPSEFIEHILSLGFNKTDADRLYEEKDSWMGVSTGGKVLCAVRGCKFHAKIASDDLFEHCRIEHGWKDHPCLEDNCFYIGYSLTALKKHASFHSRTPTTHYEYHCSARGRFLLFFFRFY